MRRMFTPRISRLRIAILGGGLCALAALLGAPESALGQQRVRFPSGSPAGPPQGVPPTYVPNPAASGNVVSASPWTPVTPGNAAALVPQLQPFDPYAVPGQPSAPVVVPTSPNPNGGLPGGAVPPLPPGGATPWTPAPGGATLGAPVFPSGPPTATSVSPLPPAYGGAPGPYGPLPPPLGGSSSYGPTAPIQPAPIFPDGLGWNAGDGRLERLLQDTGVLYTYLYGDDGAELQIHEVELFTSLVWKNFLHSPHDLRVTPGFVFDFLDGPAVPMQIDLPPTLYSTYLNFLWQPQLAPQFGADLNFRIGVYSDFDTVTFDSIRFTGRGLGVLQITPQLSFKAGVEYLDRVRLKLLPAGGFFWQPDPQTRVDIYFPRPQVARYWTTWGNTEIWWHVGAEYGGGSWTIDRVDTGASDQIDINDIRAFVGIDWNRLERWDGIFEVGYVFDREVVVRSDRSNGVKLDDTFMIRAGLKF